MLYGFLYWPPVLEGRSTALRTVTMSSCLGRSYQVFTCSRHPRLPGGERDLERSVSMLDLSASSQSGTVPDLSMSLDTTSSILGSYLEAAMMSLTSS